MTVTTVFSIVVLQCSISYFATTEGSPLSFVLRVLDVLWIHLLPIWKVFSLHAE